jgi:adenosylcobinamide-phosphate synthase
VSAVAATVGLAADALLGEPPARVHPVARFGALMDHLERSLYAPTRSRGAVHAAVGVSIALAAGAAVRRLIGPAPATALAVAVGAAGKMLDGEAAAVRAHLERAELDLARDRLASLAGRDAADLDEREISRAVIESLAENGSDAVTSTVLWAALAGAPGALVHRAVNTLDAMVGHCTARYERFGWAAARLDDVLNYVPARVTAAAVAVARPRRARVVIATIRRDAGRHPSPNGGVVEAAFAAALGLRLGGSNRYGGVVEDRGALGDGRAPVAADIGAAIRLRRDATAVVVAALLLVDGVRVLGQLARRRSR